MYILGIPYYSPSAYNYTLNAAISLNIAASSIFLPSFQYSNANDVLNELRVGTADIKNLLPASISNVFTILEEIN